MDMQYSFKMMMSNDIQVKVVIIGNSGVGKSCIISQFAFNMFDQQSSPSLGTLCISKVLEFEKYGKKVNYQLWDTAGQEEFKSMVAIYYKSAKAFIVAYSVDNRKSFEAVNGWIKEVREKAPIDAKLFIVANKSDLVEKQQVSVEEGKELADSYNSSFHVTSAKLNIGIEELFVDIALKLNIIGVKGSKANCKTSMKNGAVKLKGDRSHNNQNCC